MLDVSRVSRQSPYVQYEALRVANTRRNVLDLGVELSHSTNVRSTKLMS